MAIATDDGFPYPVQVNDRRSSSGYVKPEKLERHGKIAGFIPSRDRVLVKRLPPVTEEGGILRPTVGVEPECRGHVIAVGPCEYGAPPIGSIVDFSKYGAQEKRFDDDDGPDTYASVWMDDVHGWHNA